MAGRKGRGRRVAVPALLAALLFLSAVLCPPYEMACASIYAPQNIRSGFGYMTASFPGLTSGTAWLSRGGIEMTFGCANAGAVISLEGSALILPVKTNSGNKGTLSILLDSSLSASTSATDKLHIVWKRQVPQSGKRILVGEAVLAMVRQPRDGEKLESRNEAVPVAKKAANPPVAAATTGSAVAISASTAGPAVAASATGLAVATSTTGSAVATGTTGPAIATGTTGSAIATSTTGPAIATGTTGSAIATSTTGPGVAASTSVPGIMTSQATMSLAAGYIVRVPLWAASTGDSAFSFSLGTLGTASAPLAGSLRGSFSGSLRSSLSGSLAAPIVKETLRYVSSDVLLPQDYKPVLQWTRSLLCLKPGEVFQFNPDVIRALREMLLDAQRQGVAGFDLDNSYRSSFWQKLLFDRRLSLSKADMTIRDPLATTLRRVARPFGSEHQTGLAFDMFATSGYGINFGNTLNFRWLKEQAWKYGFVIRYPDKSEAVTKVMYEPWHIRYFGRPMAGYLAKKQIPYDVFASRVLTSGAVWLGDTEVDLDTMWLTVLAKPNASFSSGMNGLQPEISEFLPGRQIWLIPMGNHAYEVPSF